MEVIGVIGGTHVFKADNCGYECYTYWTCPVGTDNGGTNRWPIVPTDCELPIDTDAEAGVVKWVDSEDLMAGTFGEYNRALFGKLDTIPEVPK